MFTIPVGTHYFYLRDSGCSLNTFPILLPSPILIDNQSYFTYTRLVLSAYTSVVIINCTCIRIPSIGWNIILLNYQPTKVRTVFAVHIIELISASSQDISLGSLVLRFLFLQWYDLLDRVLALISLIPSANIVFVTGLIALTLVLHLSRWEVWYCDSFHKVKFIVFYGLLAFCCLIMLTSRVRRSPKSIICMILIGALSDVCLYPRQMTIIITRMTSFVWIFTDDAIEEPTWSSIAIIIIFGFSCNVSWLFLFLLFNLFKLLCIESLSLGTIEVFVNNLLHVLECCLLSYVLLFCFFEFLIEVELVFIRVMEIIA